VSRRTPALSVVHAPTPCEPGGDARPRRASGRAWQVRRGAAGRLVRHVSEADGCDRASVVPEFANAGHARCALRARAERDGRAAPVTRGGASAGRSSSANTGAGLRALGVAESGGRTGATILCSRGAVSWSTVDGSEWHACGPAIKLGTVRSEARHVRAVPGTSAARELVFVRRSGVRRRRARGQPSSGVDGGSAVGGGGPGIVCDRRSPAIALAQLRAAVVASFGAPGWDETGRLRVGDGAVSEARRSAGRGSAQSCARAGVEPRDRGTLPLHPGGVSVQAGRRGGVRVAKVAVGRRPCVSSRGGGRGGGGGRPCRPRPTGGGDLLQRTVGWRRSLGGVQRPGEGPREARWGCVCCRDVISPGSCCLSRRIEVRAWGWDVPWAGGWRGGEENRRRQAEYDVGCAEGAARSRRSGDGQDRGRRG
jgi:hypothetical protein